MTEEKWMLAKMAMAERRLGYQNEFNLAVLNVDRWKRELALFDACLWDIEIAYQRWKSQQDIVNVEADSK